MAKKQDTTKRTFKVAHANLMAALSAVQPATIKGATSLPILRTLLFSIEGQRLTIVATNLSVVLAATVPVVAESDFRAAIPARTLTDWVRLAPNDVVEFTLKSNDAMTIRCGRSTANIKGMDPEEYPLVDLRPDESELTVYRFQTGDFQELIHAVAFAASGDDTRPVLNCVRLFLADGQMTATATDGLCMADGRCNYQTGGVQQPQQTAELLLDAQYLAQFASLAKGRGDDQVELRIIRNGTQAHFKLGDGLVGIIHTHEGKYPEYQYVLDSATGAPYRYQFGRAALLHGLATAGIFGRENSWVTTFALSADNGEQQAIISSRSIETGNVTARVCAPTSKETRPASRKVRFALNGQMMTSGLKAISGQQVCFHLDYGEQELPVKLTSDDLPGWQYIIMPFKYDESHHRNGNGNDHQEEISNGQTEERESI